MRIIISDAYLIIWDYIRGYKICGWKKQSWNWMLSWNNRSTDNLLYIHTIEMTIETMSLQHYRKPIKRIISSNIPNQSVSLSHPHNPHSLGYVIEKKWMNWPHVVARLARNPTSQLIILAMRMVYHVYHIVERGLLFATLLEDELQYIKTTLLVQFSCSSPFLLVIHNFSDITVSVTIQACSSLI